MMKRFKMKYLAQTCPAVSPLTVRFKSIFSNLMAFDTNKVSRRAVPLVITGLISFSCFSPSSAQGAESMMGRNFYVDLGLSAIWTDSNTSLHGYGGAFGGEGGVGTSHEVGYKMDTTFGYAIEGAWLVGLSIDLKNSTSTRGAVSGGDTARTQKSSLSEYGPTIGFLHGGWKFIFTYLLTSQSKLTDHETDSTGALQVDSVDTNKKGSGFLLTVGYALPVTTWMELGVDLVYRSVKYSNHSLQDSVTPGNSFSDQSFSTKPVETSWTPQLDMTFRF